MDTERSRLIGDWAGSLYDVGGCRWDYSLFLDRDGRYERVERSESGFEKHDAGRWKYVQEQGVLRLESDVSDASSETSGDWAILSINDFDSNVVLILREVVLGSRILPILFYRVHGRGRGYGTDWEKQLPTHRE
jgi:hypothetical protein